MKLPAWHRGAVLVCLVLAGVLAILGWLRPGAYDWEEQLGESLPAGGGTAGVGKELREKIKVLREEQKKAVAKIERDHRVFVSRVLLFLPKDKEPVRPLDAGMATEDGIAVVWKLQHGLDPEDTQVAERDDDQDGFSNREEFEQKTDPRDPRSSPSKWFKLRLREAESAALSVSFSGKSGENLTLRLGLGTRRRDWQIRPGERYWIGASPQGLELCGSEQEADAWGQRNSVPHLIPIRILEYRPDFGQREDPRTKTLIDYDDSALRLERLDQAPEKAELLLDQPGRPRGVIWQVGAVTLRSLVPGEADLGPFRVGQTFSYAGQNFALLAAVPEKVRVKILPDGESFDIPKKTP